jgi:cytochrome c oxidase cbb3-type subunit 3
MSTFWSVWITACTVIVLAGCTWILFANRKSEVVVKNGENAKTTGHVYDGIEEYENPLPLWWFATFAGSLIFAVGYFIWYPGLGSYEGMGGWTQIGQLEEQQAKADAKYGEIFAQFSEVPVVELATIPEARQMGRRLFVNNCSVCHGTAADGAYGFPNLTDSDWLYGSDPETIKNTITHGRQGAMPAWQDVISDNDTNNVVEYVIALSGGEHDAETALLGGQTFGMFCASCHAVDGKGIKEVGAPNLTDKVWLYGGSRDQLRQTIYYGRKGNMPAQQDILRADKIHLLTAYIYSLSAE